MIILYLVLTFFLSIYSFGQVDLNLNLSKNEIYLWFENQMKYLGYYQRNLSFWIFLSLSLILIILYGIMIFKNKFLKVSHPRAFYFLFFIFYLISYPAFLSYDIFNYFFDARIVIKYRENPYLFSAQRYVFDEWLRFMRWTHRTYPYGPVWILLTLVPVFLGFGKLVPTIFFFKIFNLLIFLGCIKLIKLISGSKNSWLLFALHPIVIYDFLVSMHNESLMLFFLLASIYFLIKKRNWWTIIFLLLSAGVKFVTAALLPVYLFLWWRKIDVRKNLPTILRVSWILMIVALVPVFLQREIYSWYFILPIGLMVICPGKLEKAALFVLSFLILRYTPFILIGEYNKQVLDWQNWISYVALSLIGIAVTINYLKRINFQKR
jgi:hypothetical protein